MAFEDDLADGPLAIGTDRGQMEQLLMNLVVNAAGAMPDRGPVAIRTRREAPATAVSAPVPGTCGRDARTTKERGAAYNRRPWLRASIWLHGA